MAHGANAAILYRPEGFETTGPRLMGRQAAGEGFLKGFVQHADVDRLYCYAPRREQAEHFNAAVKGNGNTRPVQWLNEIDARTPAQAGTLYLPDPSVSLHAWRRRHFDQRLYSIVGITHTTGAGMGCADLHLDGREADRGFRARRPGRVPGRPVQRAEVPAAAAPDHPARHRHRRFHAE
jgi:hypothetical protein